MEGSESDSAPLSISNGEDPQLGASSPPPSPPPQPSDLNHAAEHEILSGELHSKLDLKGEDETEDKVSDLNDRGGVCDEETAKGDADSRGSETNSWDEELGVDADEDGVGIGDVHGDDGEEHREERNSDVTHHYPLRPEAEDCAFYMKTGNCKFGFNCKFNHPIRRKTQVLLVPFFFYVCLI